MINTQGFRRAVAREQAAAVSSTYNVPCFRKIASESNNHIQMIKRLLIGSYRKSNSTRRGSVQPVAKPQTIAPIKQTQTSRILHSNSNAIGINTQRAHKDDSWNQKLLLPRTQKPWRKQIVLLSFTSIGICMKNSILWRIKS
jgi:hypothetical protein